MACYVILATGDTMLAFSFRVTFVLLGILISSHPADARDAEGEAALRSSALSLETSRKSYAEFQRWHELASENLQSRMKELATKLRESQKIGPYQSEGAKTRYEVNEMITRIREATHSFNANSMKVQMNGDVVSNLDYRRSRYFDQVRNISIQSDQALSALNLPKDVKADVDFARATHNLSPAERLVALNAYEGRLLGEAIKTPDQLKGLEKIRDVRLSTYETEQSVRIRNGQVLKMQSPSGALVQGVVAGVLPDGRVVLENKWHSSIADLKNLDPGRIVDLNKMAQVNIYDDVGKFSVGHSAHEITLRHTTKKIVDTVKSGHVANLVRGAYDNGYGTRHHVWAITADRRMGESVNTFSGFHELPTGQ